MTSEVAASADVNVFLLALPISARPVSRAGCRIHRDCVKPGMVCPKVRDLCRLSVNDAFVMDAWGKNQKVGDRVTMLADGAAEARQSGAEAMLAQV
jgi:hypothetical protein